MTPPTAPLTIHIADLPEVRNLLGQLELERDAAHQECAELREQIAADIEVYCNDVLSRADEPGHFGDLTTGQAVGIALSTAIGLIRRVS